MFSIIYHLTGISILEICFFFYYVGPMETEMFTHTVDLLIQDLDSQTDISSNQELKQNISTLLGLSLNEINNNTDNMRDMYYDGKNQRDEKNNALFIKAINYWGILCIISIIVGVMHYRYIQHRKLLKYNGVVTVTANECIETGDIQSYRKGSIDAQPDELLIYSPTLINSNSNTNTNSNKKDGVIKMIVHYTMFGGLIITFQYLFFRYIIYYYNPLSLNETKYLIYQKLLTDIS